MGKGLYMNMKRETELVAQAMEAARQADISARRAQKIAGSIAGAQESWEQAERSAAYAAQASQSEQRTAAAEANVAQAEERINKTVSGAVEAVAAQETKSVQAVAAEGERVLGTIPQDYTAAVGEIDALKKKQSGD